VFLHRDLERTPRELIERQGLSLAGRPTNINILIDRGFDFSFFLTMEMKADLKSLISAIFVMVVYDVFISHTAYVRYVPRGRIRVEFSTWAQRAHQ
jgi:hypothetical protein